MADPGDLPALAAEVSAALTAAGIVHALSRSLSMAAFARPRATLDADFLVVAPAIRWPEVFAIVREQGFAGDDRESIRSMRERGHAMFRSGPVALDILIPQIPYHHDVANRAVRLRLAGRVRITTGRHGPCPSMRVPIRVPDHAPGSPSAGPPVPRRGAGRFDGCARRVYPAAMSLRDRITTDADVLVGKPVVRGTRISVELVLDLLAQGWTAERILEQYDHLTEEDIRACVEYAADLLREESVFAVPR
jgi:uncharacterized protein (DUF433 family)